MRLDCGNKMWKIIIPFYRESRKQEVRKILALLSLLRIPYSKITYSIFRGEKSLEIYLGRTLSDNEAKLLHIKVWDYVHREYLVI